MTLWNAEGLKPIGYLVWPLRSLKVRNPFLTLTWPGDLTFGDLGLKCLHKVSNSIFEQVLKKWRRCAPPFFRYPRKTGGVGIFCPPSSARVKSMGKISTTSFSHQNISIHWEWCWLRSSVMTQATVFIGDPSKVIWGHLRSPTVFCE